MERTQQEKSPLAENRQSDGKGLATPVTAPTNTAAQQRNDSPETLTHQGPPSTSASPPEGSPDTVRNTQSDYSLSQSSAVPDEDGRFSVAEEVNLDQQSDQARQVGQLPKDTRVGRSSESAADALKKSLQQGQ